MTRDDAERLALYLGLGLDAPGVCLPCLGMVADELERGEAPAAGSAERWVVATLWSEGLGRSVAAALDRAVRARADGAVPALADFQARGCRSEIYRAVVRRLALDLAEETRRAIAASLN